MFSLKRCDQLLQRAVEKHWDSSDLIVRCCPQVNREHGDFSTDVCMRISSKYGINPKQAADRIISGLSDDFGSQLRYEEGFLNFCLPNTIEGVDEAGWEQICEPVKRECVVITGLGDKISPWAALRIAASGLYHALMIKRAGGRVSFMFKGKALKLPEEGILSAAVPLIREVFELAVGCDRGSHAELELFSSPPAEIFNWYFHKEQGEALGWKAECLKGGTRVIDVYTARQWRGPVKTGLEACDLRGLDDCQLISLFWLLTAPVYARDLKPEEALSPGWGDIVWLIDAAGERMGGACGTYTEINKEKAMIAPDRRERRLLVRLCYLPYFFVSGAENGSVRGFTGVCFDALRKINTFLNDSKLRKRIKEKSLFPLEHVVLYKASEAVKYLKGWIGVY